jgi:uncharacterized protein (TIGR02391 family)
VNDEAGPRRVVQLGRQLSSDLAEYKDTLSAASAPAPSPISPTAAEHPVAEYDRRITDDALRLATRSRFVSEHYADAVEAAVKALNECVRERSGSTADGDALMTSVFSEKNPKLRLNRLRTDSDRSEQRGHMMMCQGVVAAWRNPRAHSSQFQDSPETTLMMLEHIQHLIEVTRQATKTRAKRKSTT